METVLSDMAMAAQQLMLGATTPLGDARWRWCAAPRMGACDILSVLDDAARGARRWPEASPIQARAVLRQLASRPWRAQAGRVSGTQREVTIRTADHTIVLLVGVTGAPELKAIRVAARGALAQ